MKTITALEVKLVIIEVIDTLHKKKYYFFGIFKKELSIRVGDNKTDFLVIHTVFCIIH